MVCFGPWLRTPLCITGIIWSQWSMELSCASTVAGPAGDSMFAKDPMYKYDKVYYIYIYISHLKAPQNLLAMLNNTSGGETEKAACWAMLPCEETCRKWEHWLGRGTSWLSLNKHGASTKRMTYTCEYHFGWLYFCSDKGRCCSKWWYV